MTNTVEIMCGETLPDLPTVLQVQAEFNGLCSAPISDIAVNETIEGEACTGFRRIRTISGVVDLDLSLIHI